MKYAGRHHQHFYVWVFLILIWRNGMEWIRHTVLCLSKTEIILQLLFNSKHNTDVDPKQHVKANKMTLIEEISFLLIKH